MYLPHLRPTTRQQWVDMPGPDYDHPLGVLGWQLSCGHGSGGPATAEAADLGVVMPDQSAGDFEEYPRETAIGCDHTADDDDDTVAPVE